MQGWDEVPGVCRDRGIVARASRYRKRGDGFLFVATALLIKALLGKEAMCMTALDREMEH